MLKFDRVIGQGGVATEYVRLKADEDCNLRDYMITDRTFGSDGETDLTRHSYWFPDYTVKKGDYVALLTREGTDGPAPMNSGKSTLHRFYWNLGTPVWNDAGDTAYLVRLAGVTSMASKPASKPAIKPKPPAKPGPG